MNGISWIKPICKAQKNGLPHYSKPFHVNPPLSVFVKKVKGLSDGRQSQVTICLTEY